MAPLCPDPADARTECPTYMRLTVVTSNYPSRSRPSCGTFVREAVRAFSRQGAECRVICPTSFADLRYGALDGFRTIDQTEDHSTVETLRPRHLTFSSKSVLGFNTGVMSDACFEGAAARVAAGLVDRTDVLYGHFLYPSGRTVARLGKKYGLPVFVAHGDGVLNEMYSGHAAEDFRDVTGAIAVSRPNRKFCENVLHLPPERVGLFPNGVDLRKFRPLDKVEMRLRLGLPADGRLVAFVGHFLHIKGPDRVIEAVERLENVQVLVIGSGPMKLSSSRIAFLGEVDHQALPEYLCAADVFVLPTLEEGCCNSLLEAMACGLPVVSSTGEFNDDILNESVSIRVDPLDVSAISGAVEKVLDDESLKLRMSSNCRVHSQKFSVDNRARAILDWIESLVGRPDTLENAGRRRQ